MPKSASIRARIDPQLKEEVETILQELGISTTQALTLFYQQIRLNRGLPFAVRLPAEEGGGSEAPPHRPSAPFPVDPARSTMQKNIEAYQGMHGDLVERYLGQYVAICEGRLVDHDPDPVALLARVRAAYPQQVVLRQKVEPVPDREWHVRHPHMEPRP